MAITAEAGGQPLPQRTIPAGLLRLATHVPGAGRMLRVPSNLREVIRTSDGVTFWGNHAKATAELGYAPRDLASGARDAFGHA
jgi:hypothetical protein